MRKLLLATLALLLGITDMSAQTNSEIFNHLGTSIGVGTTGITIDLSTPVTHYLGIRAGVDIIPTIKYSTNLNIEYPATVQTARDVLSAHGINTDDLPKNIEVEGKASLVTEHILLDIFPFKNSSFHLTTGIYFGGSKVIKVYNKKEGVLSLANTYNDYVSQNPIVAKKYGLTPAGIQLGNYFLTPDDEGNVNAYIKTNKIRPYIGLGFGRSVPTEHHLACQFDIGVQLLGTPKVYIQDDPDPLTEQDTEGKDGGLIKAISKSNVYPCLSLRLVGRIL